MTAYTFNKKQTWTNFNVVSREYCVIQWLEHFKFIFVKCQILQPLQMHGVQMFKIQFIFAVLKLEYSGLLYGFQFEISQ